MLKRTFVFVTWAILLPGSQAEEPPVTAEPRWPVDHFETVPFVLFRASGLDLHLGFRADRLCSRITRGARSWAELPPRQLPVKVVEITPDRHVIFCRHLFSGNLALFERAGRESLRELTLPDRLKYGILHQAVYCGQELLLVFYNVYTRVDLLYRWNLESDGQLIFDENFVRELPFGGVCGIEANIAAKVHQKAVYFVGSGNAFRYSNLRGDCPSLARLALPEHLEFVEVGSDDQGVAAMACDVREQEPLKEAALKKATSPAGPPLLNAGRPGVGDWPPVLRAFDIASQNEILLPPVPGLRTQLRRDGGIWTTALVNDSPSMVHSLERDLMDCEPSGILNLGINNFEGQVAWAQAYYLEGMMDLLEFAPRTRKPEYLVSFLRKLRLRLDLEMYLLDRMLDSPGLGLISKRYSVGRAPLVTCVQSARVLSLVQRYQNGTPRPLTLTSFDKLRRCVLNLEGHIETLRTASEGEPDLMAGQPYFRITKGVAFPFDGLNLPYNCQNQWSQQVAHSVREGRPEDKQYLDTARDLVRFFLKNEGFYQSPPKDFDWHYWWGQGRRGWTATEGFSVHTPAYEGFHSMAHISYRTMDVMAALAVGRKCPEVLPPRFAQYVEDGIQAGGLYPFTYAELSHNGCEPKLPVLIRGLYGRVNCPWKFRNAAWVLLAFARDAAGKGLSPP